MVPEGLAIPFAKASNDACEVIIKEPVESIVHAEPTTKFVYVMRKDPQSVCTPIAAKIAAEYRIPQDEIAAVITPAYNQFVTELADVLGQNFVSKGRTEIHLFSDEAIESKRSKYLGERTTISLDPFVEGEGIESIGLSRGYLPGGTVEIGMMPRPGFPPLHDQITAIKARMGTSNEVNIFEDDIYTGGSITRIVKLLSQEGIVVKRIVPGIQIGTPQSLLDMGIETSPAIQYHLNKGQEIDLGDPRDFLIGADGLVVALHGNKQGRLPYVAPFVCPTARLSIPRKNQKHFSQDILKINRQFFAYVEDGLAIDLGLRHMNSVSAFAMQTLVPESEGMRMTAIIDHILDQQNAVKRSCDFHKNRSAVRVLDLPKEIVFLDVNGTILPSDSKDGHINADDLHKFQHAVSELEKTGMVVGLNSDSPLPQLREFAQKLGIPDAPILAENGALIAYKDKQIPMRDFEDLKELKTEIEVLAKEKGMVRSNDVVSPEFGGKELPPGTWAFGANRTASLSVFADEKFTSQVKQLIEDRHGVGNISCDHSPEHGFLGVHTGKDFREGKADTVLKLVREGHVIVSIGDSMSDYVPFALPNQVVFVKDGLPEMVVRQPHVRVSGAKGLAGVIETLTRLAYRNNAPSMGHDHTYVAK